MALAEARMQDLRLVGMSEDGCSIILTSGPPGADPRSGEQRYRVAIDDALRAVLRYAALRPGAGEGGKAAGGAMGPREIQSRIRSGETAEEVASASGVPLEKVRKYEGPVLAEREHIAHLAQRGPVRLRPADAHTTPRPGALADAVAARLADRGVTTETLGWDAWRRDDGRWTVRVSYPSGCATQQADFVYDAASKVSLPFDEHARWLLGEEPAQPEEGLAFVPRLAAVGAENDLSVDPRREPMVAATTPGTTGGTAGVTTGGTAGGTSAGALGSRPATKAGATAMTAPAASAPAVPTPAGRGPAVPAPVPVAPAAAAASPAPAAGSAEAEHPAGPQPDQPPDQQPESRPAARPAAGGSRGRRAAVPAWDDILFGVKRTQ